MFDTRDSTEPGLHRLRIAVSALAAEDWTDRPATEVGEGVVELRRLIDGLEGVWSRLVAVLDGSGSLPAETGTATWLRSACRLSPGVARRRVVLARRLSANSAVDAGLVAGDISVDHAQLVTTALAELEEAAGAPLAAAATVPLLEAGRRCDPARLRREIAHARHALVPEVAIAADEAAHRRRHLDVASTFDGTVVVNGVLDAEGGEALLTALAPLCGRSGPDDDRSPSHRRADGLVELCRRALDGGALPAAGGERPHLTVLVPLAALPSRPEPGVPGRAGSACDTASCPPTAAALLSAAAHPAAAGNPAAVGDPVAVGSPAAVARSATAPGMDGGRADARAGGDGSGRGSRMTGGLAAGSADTVWGG